jgi:hypothetical protein
MPQRPSWRLHWTIGLVVFNVCVAGAFLGYYFWPASPPLDPARVLIGPGPVSQLAFHPDGSRLIAMHGAHDIVLWDLASGKKSRAFRLPGAEDGTQIFEERAQPARARREARERLGMIFAAPPFGGFFNSLPASLPCPFHPVEPFAVNANDTPASSFAVIGTAEEPWLIAYSAFEFSVPPEDEFGKRDRQHAATVARLRVARYPLKEDDQPSGESHFTYDGKSARSVGFSADGRRVLLAKPEGPLSVVENEFAEGRLHSDFRALDFANPGGKIQAIRLLPDGTRALMADENGEVGVWDLHRAKELYPLAGLQSPLDAFALTPDGHQLVTGNADGRITLWDVETGQRVREYRGHQSAVRRLAISPDGARFLSDGADRTLRLWDAKLGKELRQLTYPDLPCTALAFSPAGNRIAVASGLEIHIWDSLP